MKTRSGLSQQEEQPNKNNKPSSIDSQTNWQQLESMEDEDIDLSDIPELTKEEFQRAKPLHQLLGERGIDYTPGAPSILVTYHDDGSTSTYQLAPESNIVVLDPDVQRYFHDSATVNRTLRALIQLVPQPH